MNVLLAENLFWNFLPRKTPNSVAIWFLKNHDMEKKWLINSFWRKNFGRPQILKQVFTTRQTLNQDFQKMSDFQSTLNNSSFLESEILQHVKFWNISFTTRQILVRNFNNATDFYVILVLKNEIFLDNLLLKNLSKHVLIQANLKQLVSFWIRTFAACQF